MLMRLRKPHSPTLSQWASLASGTIGKAFDSWTELGVAPRQIHDRRPFDCQIGLGNHEEDSDVSPLETCRQHLLPCFYPACRVSTPRLGSLIMLRPKAITAGWRQVFTRSRRRPRRNLVVSSCDIMPPTHLRHARHERRSMTHHLLLLCITVFAPASNGSVCRRTNKSGSE